MADDDPTTYRLSASREGRYHTRVDTGEETFDVDTDTNPVEYLLGSLLGCLQFTADTVAREMDVDLEDVQATVEGDIDYSAYKGEETDARAGLQDVRVTMTVAADAGDDTLAELRGAVEERCPVSDTLANGTALSVELECVR